MPKPKNESLKQIKVVVHLDEEETKMFRDTLKEIGLKSSAELFRIALKAYVKEYRKDQLPTIEQ